MDKAYIYDLLKSFDRWEGGLEPCKLSGTELYTVALLKEFDGDFDLVEKVVSFQEKWGKRSSWRVREIIDVIKNQQVTAESAAQGGE
tara:strand:+ start:334 stop:594 length:261 start_codon:yes stop_codon:yes gene_type:complete